MYVKQNKYLFKGHWRKKNTRMNRVTRLTFYLIKKTIYYYMYNEN